MKLISSFLLLFIFTLTTFADQLILIELSNSAQSSSLLHNPAIRVHHFNDRMAIATVNFQPKEPHTILAQNPWNSNLSYYIVYTPANGFNDYLNDVSEQINLLYQDTHLIVVSIDELLYGQLKPAKNDGMIRIQPTSAIRPPNTLFIKNQTFNPDPFIENLIAQVEADNISATVQHLEDYGTRNAYTSQSVLAQNWIKNAFTDMGLNVVLHDFNMPSGSASDNVIATKTGTKYPDEYIVCGAHYDSYSYSGAAPGADDNASGTAGVLEIARIISQYDFDRSIIFCAFSGEEYGLYGSAAYASMAAQQGLDIQGYFNLDMIGYLKPGNTIIKSTLIYPSSATELATFYTETAATYLPQFVIEDGSLSGGDSDHTSFNNNGFMGIFPFEAVPDYSPYIHTSGDLVGPSYNHPEQAVIFTQASLPAVATMANRLTPPRNLVAMPGNNRVDLYWTNLVGITNYRIYRDGIVVGEPENNEFTDIDVLNGTQYTYYVTAIYADSGNESEPSNPVDVTPMAPISLPLLITFENGSPYLDLQGSWGVTNTASHSPSYSLTESPDGNYQNNLDIHATLTPFSLNNGVTDAELRFWTKYNMEANYDYMYLEISTNGNNWNQLGQFNGAQNIWTEKTYSLNAYLGQPYIQIRFRFYSDGSVTGDGFFLDDFQIEVQGGFNEQLISLPVGWSGISSYVLPQETDITQLLQPISDRFEVLQHTNTIYWPQNNQNSIGFWDSQTGYKIKLTGAVDFIIAGPEFAQTTVEIEEGWNLLPVLSNCPVNIENLLSQYPEQVEMIKEIAGVHLYWPQLEFNSLSILQPGHAYYLLANDDFLLTFPECNTAYSLEPENHRILIEDPFLATGNSHIVGFATETLQFAEEGDLIMAFNADGLCVGLIEISNPLETNAITIFGNDSTSSIIDGMQVGETITFKWKRLETGYYHPLDVNYNPGFPHAENYQHEGISMIDAIIPDLVSSSEVLLRTGIRPNPVEDHVQISFNYAGIADIQIISLDGRLHKHFSAKSPSGVNVSDLPSGIYTIKVTIENQTTNSRFLKK